MSEQAPASLPAWSYADLARLCAASVQAAPPTDSARWLPAQVSTDSRSLRPGDLFVALDGARFRAADFLSAAKAAGATLAVVAQKDVAAATAAGMPFLAVAEPVMALGALGQDVRRRQAKPVAAVTGSNGKTTTKELLAAALTGPGPVHRTQGNLNNFIGVPKTLLSWQPEAWAAVVEMGMNAPGEIAHLTRLAEPNLGIITCVAAAHLAGLGTLENVARAKVELLQALPAGASRIVNADDDVLLQAAAPYLDAGPSLRFGSRPGADVRLVSCRAVLAGHGVGAQPGLEVAYDVQGQQVTGTLPLLGRHNAVNAAAALAGALCLGVAPARALANMAAVQLPPGRLALAYVAARDIYVLDDGYNANPGSMRAALNTALELVPAERLYVVLGDMRELGPTAAALHQALGQDAAGLGLTRLWAVGAQADNVAAGARRAGMAAGQARAFADTEAVLVQLEQALRPGDWVLIKGSRGMRMERVAAGLGVATAAPATHA